MFSCREERLGVKDPDGYDLPEAAGTKFIERVRGAVTCMSKKKGSGVAMRDLGESSKSYISILTFRFEFVTVV